MIPEDPYGKIGPSLECILHKLKADAKVDEKYIEATHTTTATAIVTPAATTATITDSAATATAAATVTTVILTDNDDPSLIVCED